MEIFCVKEFNKFNLFKIFYNSIYDAILIFLYRKINYELIKKKYYSYILKDSVQESCISCTYFYIQRQKLVTLSIYILSA